MIVIYYDDDDLLLLLLLSIRYMKDYPVYYAGPAKTPAGYASGSFGPTTAGRMDSCVSVCVRACGIVACACVRACVRV